jgi:hypothetical protein
MTVITASWRGGRLSRRSPAKTVANGNLDGNFDGKSRPGIEQAMQERWRMAAGKSGRKAGQVSGANRSILAWLESLGHTIEQYRAFVAALEAEGVSVEVEYDRATTGMTARRYFTLSVIDSLGFEHGSERAAVLKWTITDLELRGYLQHPDVVLLEFERMRAANADMTDDERRELDWQVLR